MRPLRARKLCCMNGTVEYMCLRGEEWEYERYIIQFAYTVWLSAYATMSPVPWVVKSTDVHWKPNASSGRSLRESIIVSRSNDPSQQMTFSINLETYEMTIAQHIHLQQTLAIPYPCGSSNHERLLGVHQCRSRTWTGYISKVQIFGPKHLL